MILSAWVPFFRIDFVKEELFILRGIILGFGLPFFCFGNGNNGLSLRLNLFIFGIITKGFKLGLDFECRVSHNWLAIGSHIDFEVGNFL